MKNGYFKVVNDGTGYGIKIFAPVDGGEPVRVKEAVDYLAMRNIVCEMSKIRAAVDLNTDTVVHLDAGQCPVFRADYVLSLSDDLMDATVRFFAPSDGANPMDPADFMRDLQGRQIVAGVQTQAIYGALKNEMYCTDISVAKGIPPKQGKSAVIEYYFNTSLDTRPTLNEDGSVDFFNLNTINHCKEGDVLAKLIPAVPGEFGMNIKGAKIKPADVKQLILRYGNNIAIDESKTILTSLVSGHVCLTEGRVFVTDVLRLENVNLATGNINYDGSVEISGNVQTGFSVKAKGNVVVNGIVEGAEIEAGGDIILAKGMAGMARGTLKAGGNIVAKFLENTSAQAGGYVSAESILHSTVLAGSEITVDGRKGFITGGRVCAANQINVKTLGSNMGASTVVEVGADPLLKQRLANAQKQVAELTKTIKSIEPIVTTFALKKKQGAEISKDQMAYLANLLKLREQKMPELMAAQEEVDALQEELEKQQNASVIVKGEVFPGTKIAIGDVSMVVQSSMKYCKFVKLRGDVKMTSL